LSICIDFLQFINDLEKRLRPLALRERENLLSLKHQECKERGLPFDSELYVWDYRYYDRMFKEKTLDLDYDLVKQHFPVEIVVPAVLEVYQSLLGVRFEEIKGGGWHQGN
jgi:Zn-dependent oligopeptidase